VVSVLVGVLVGVAGAFAITSVTVEPWSTFVFEGSCLMTVPSGWVLSSNWSALTASPASVSVARASSSV